MTTTYTKPLVLATLEIDEILVEAFGGSGSTTTVPSVCNLTNVGKH